jgi:hypothetical protein
VSAIDWHLLVLALSLVLAAALPLAGQSSFEEIRSKVYANPRTQNDLPQYEGAGAWETFRATTLSMVSERIAASMRRTLSSQSDYKDATVKLFHPKGVCGEATWEILAGNRYTGLFAKGTRIPAIVRLSTGGNNTKYYATLPTSEVLGHHRNLGVAVKLFPTQDRAAKVATQNLLTFDQTGLDGNPSPWFMRGARTKANQYGEQFFTNWMAGTGLVTTGFARLFSAFATDVRLRRIDHLGATDGRNQPVPTPHAPRFVKLVPSATFHADQRQNQWDDFRKELLDLGKLGALAFDIIATDSNPTEPSAADPGIQIGRLTLGSPVVSEFCDQQLHFPHLPNR